RALARLLTQVAHALAYAHARAVVHRDLKPDNVLVLRDGRTKMLDFGLAGLHAEGAEVLTQSNVAMGTANYMAPEQRKDARRADHRCGRGSASAVESRWCWRSPDSAWRTTTRARRRSRPRRCPPRARKPAW